MSAIEQAERSLAAADEAFSHYDVEALVAHLSAAIRHLTAAGVPRQAAMACVRLGDAYANALGNATAARAWFTRAARLVADEPPCVEQGWVAVAAMGCVVGDPDELLSCAELALDRARMFGDVNLETKALADGGLAHVQAGRVAQGMAMLEEAMALACGPADQLDTKGKSACSFFTACYYSGDFGRAASWADLLRQHGVIGGAPGAQIFLSSHCDTVQASLLVELGRWSEAEALLVGSMAAWEQVMPIPSWHPRLALADLRTRQGRLAEAETLLVGSEGEFEALLPFARLQLARGDAVLARAAALRGLRALGSDRLRAVELLTVLVDAELTLGDLDAARAACEQLAARTEGLDVDAARSRGCAARARVLAATGNVGAALDLVEETVDRLDTAQLPWFRATLLVELARLREGVDPAAAAVDAKAAASSLAALDVVVPPADAALIERLSGLTPSARPATTSGTAELRRDHRGWLVSHDGTSVRLPDTKGIRYLAALVEAAGAERHALDLVDRIEGVDAGGLDRRALGDAGELLDSSARTAYRHRIEELRADIDDALEAQQFDKAEQLQAELDQLVGQLAQAFGLGGRERRAASAAERARLNVTRALRTAIAKVAGELPAAGAALDRAVRTGLYCSYSPREGDIRWIVQS